MKKTATQCTKRILLFCGAFVAVVFVEMSLRAAQEKPIPFDSSEIPEVTITASRKPDFLWIGTAWSISYKSSVPFDLDIGTGASAQVPAGTHKIYSNHDQSNLDEYGLKFSEDYPQSITARPTKP